MLRKVTPEDAERIRDEVEETLRAAVEEALRSFLADVRRAALAGLSPSPQTGIAAAATPAPAPPPLPEGDLPTLGETAGRWAAGVDATIMGKVRDSFASVWGAYTDVGLVLTDTSLAAQESYLGAVRDRLVTGTYFGVPVHAGAFEAIREPLALSAAEGWTRPQLAQRIAAELSWEVNGPYWRSEKARLGAEIDSILDPLGSPGTPAREWARLNDPRVQDLRNQMNRATLRLDAERSVWQTRADLIARTESTGVTNYGAYSALVSEGAESKEWVSTGDRRTRASHRNASGQRAKTSEPFTVGGALLMFPGDPQGPVEEVANCRCAMVAAEYLTPGDRAANARIRRGDDFGG